MNLLISKSSNHRHSMRFIIIALFIMLLLPAGIRAQKFENLAQTPPMGWNSWNTFACDVNEDLIKEIADAMVKSGMREAGYEYINIDDCWHGKRDSLGFIHPDPERFPSGMKALADYVHSKGLKLGIYSDAGTNTCAGYPGSMGHEYQDALQYAKWGIDYLKYDWCNTGTRDAKEAYTTMRDALYKAGRPIVFSICEWGDNNPWLWAKEIGHLWRTTGDIINCFNCELDHGSWSSWGIMRILDMQNGLRQYAGPGHWNDPDMMEVGNGMSVHEDRAHFTMWAMLAAPLIAGNDLRNMNKETVEILTNKEVIAVNQDTSGYQALRFIDRGDIEIWFKPLAGNDWAMAILNRGDEEQMVTYNWTAHPLQDDLSQRYVDFNQETFKLRDLWKHKMAGNTNKALDVKIPGHDVVMYRLEML